MITVRFPPSSKLTDEFLKGFLEGVEEYPGCCDEVWLTTESCCPLPERYERYATRTEEIAALLREKGLRVSLQFANTLGHGDYFNAGDLSAAKRFHFDTLVDAEMHESVASYCPNDEAFSDYFAEMAARYCRFLPDAIWFDDDLRPRHCGEPLRCFCPHCTRLFNERFGTEYTPEERVLIAEQDVSVRKKFYDFAVDSLVSFAVKVAKAGLCASPDSALGLQHGDYGGDYFARILKAFSFLGSGKTLSRPGAGGYNDYVPADFVRKANSLAWQNMLARPYANRIVAEVENWPHAAFGKTAAGMLFESGLYLAEGCDELSYAVYWYGYESPDFVKGILKEFAGHAPFWKELSGYRKRTEPIGVRVVYPKNRYPQKGKGGKEDKIFDGDLCFDGVPLVCADIPSRVSLLKGSVASQLTDEEIGSLLGQNLITDGETIHILEERGFGEALDMRAEPFPKASLFYTRFTRSPINGDMAGKIWGVYGVHNFRLFSRSAEILGRYETLSDLANIEPDCFSDGIVTTRAGGKWCVFGADPWIRGISLAKRDQIVRVIDFLSDGRALVRPEGTVQCRVIPLVENGSLAAVFVANCSMQDVENFVLYLRTQAKGAEFHSAKEQISLFVDREGELPKVIIPRLKAFDCALIILV